MKRAAILDLGTNTFNLLIAEQNSQKGFSILVNRKIPVKLGEGRINEGEIIPAAFERGIQAVATHYKTIQQYKVNRIQVFGTSALRTARNGNEFLKLVKAISGLDIEVISGDREAELIYLGVRQSLNLNDEKFVVLDIGGGSNELIIADMHKIFWKKSYPLGIARLLEKFSPSDPINPAEIELINGYLTENLGDLFEELQKYRIHILVGASGSFETFVTMLRKIEVLETECMLSEISTPVDIQEYLMLHEQLVSSTASERSAMKGLEPMRIEMIVLASLFVNHILKHHTFERIIQSNFALKEGAVLELLNN